MSVFCEVFTSFSFFFASEEWIMLIVGLLHRHEKGHEKKDSWVTVERPGEDA